jgi:cobalamin-dependent methionine synthase I
MILEIIGEKINDTRRRVAQAIAERDVATIRDLVWLVKTVQDVVDVPLCLDSANPTALAAAIAVVERRPPINSVNGEPERLAGDLPLVAQHHCRVIALAMDGARIPETTEARMAIVRRLLAETRARGIPDEQVYVDPLVMAVATNQQSGVVSLDTMRVVRHEFPQAHLTCGLSNMSFILTAELVLGRDRFSRRYTHAYRAGLLG